MEFIPLPPDSPEVLLAEALKAKENAEKREGLLVQECEGWRKELEKARETIARMERENDALRRTLEQHGRTCHAMQGIGAALEELRRAAGESAKMGTEGKRK